MKKGSIFTTIGMLIYLVVSIIDRFVLEIADYIYIPIMLIGILIIIIGIIQNRRNK
jgi:prepilin signal peptidase PulO-like enzyme (type II secretory pathway)